MLQTFIQCHKLSPGRDQGDVHVSMGDNLPLAGWHSYWLLEHRSRPLHCVLELCAAGAEAFPVLSYTPPALQSHLCTSTPPEPLSTSAQMAAECILPVLALW